MRRVLPLAVLSLAIPAAVIALPVLTAPKPSPHPVAPSTQQVAVALPASAALYPASPGALSETPEVSTRNFRMVGLSWAHDPGVANVTAKVRVRTNGSWTGWQQIDSSDSGPDGGSDAGANSAAATADRDGTDPLWVDHADGVQAEVVSVTGDLPKDLRLDLIDPGSSAADATVASSTTPASSALADAAEPTILTRAQWGADESLRQRACPGGPEYTGTPKVAFLHHTVTSNAYQPADVPAIIRSIYAYHVQSEGWCDVGYNFLVDAFGNIWEGRYGGVDRAVLGAQAGGFNTDSFGVALIGTFTTATPPAAMMTATAQLMAWKLALSYANPVGTTTLTAASYSGSRYAAGTTVSLNVISGHRDVDQTDCPGNGAYALLPALRQQVLTDMGAGLVTPSATTAVPRSLSANGSVHVTAGMLAAGDWQLLVQDSAGNEVRTLSGSGSSVDTSWDMTNDSGVPVPAGSYTLTLTSSQNGQDARPWTTSVPVGGVFGTVDAVSSPATATAEVTGVALQGTNDAPATVRVTVNGATATSTQATVSRPDVAASDPGYSAAHGYDVTVPAPGGADTICVYGVNSAISAPDTLLGCKAVTVAGVLKALSGTAANPIGHVDGVEGGPHEVHVRGWALDPETSDPISVAVSVDNHPMGSYQAAGSRPDIAKAYAGYGAGHGFDQVVTGIGPGSHQVCIYALNIGNGTTNPTLGCVQTTVPSGSPFGSYDSATMTSPGHVQLSGWTIDPDSSSSLRVDVYVDGKGAASLQASGARPDVARVYPLYGSAHGFQTTLSLGGGKHSICAFGINVGPGGNTLLGCRTVTLPTGSPIGSYDAATMTTPGQLQVRGWALDPDTTAPVRIDAYVDGKGATSVQADGARPDVGAIYPAYGSAHGFQTTLNLSAGKHSVCLFAINVGPGGNTLLGCRTVTMPSGSPLGSFDSATALGGGQVEVKGWALDPDTASAIRVDFYVDGLGATSATADVERPDIAKAFPPYGSTHGFDTTFSAAAGTHQVCAYAINVGAGAASTKLGCKTVAVS